MSKLVPRRCATCNRAMLRRYDIGRHECVACRVVEYGAFQPEYWGFQVGDILSDTVELAGSQKDAAAELGVSAQYLSDVLHGRREVGTKLAQAMGLKRIVKYVQDEVEE